MEKIFDLGVESYVAAKPQHPLNSTDYILLFVSTIFDIVKFTVLSIPCWIESFMYLFVSRPKKNVAGQVVLVYICPIIRSLFVSKKKSTPQAVGLMIFVFYFR